MASKHRYRFFVTVTKRWAITQIATTRKEAIRKMLYEMDEAPNIYLNSTRITAVRSGPPVEEDEDDE